jgi:hypothetical protein
MEREQIIQWARDAARGHPDYKEGGDAELPDAMVIFLEGFARLVRDDYSNKHAQLWLKRIDKAVRAEREACAKVCETHAPTTTPTWVSYAAAIRARGNT